MRVNPREYFDEVNETIGLMQVGKTHAIGENIHKFDLWATIWHVVGFAAVIIGGGLAIWATNTFHPGPAAQSRRVADDALADRS